MSKLHYLIPSACGIENPARSTNVTTDVTCARCRRTRAFLSHAGPARLTDDELNDLAIRIVRGDTYIANDGDALTLSFGWMFGMLDSQPDYEQIGAVYEDMSKASSRSINGYPFFVSMKLLHAEDLEPLRAKIEAKREALQTA